ncbi:hypothetical protein MRX96_042255 [Rhipicephalus microplus]
MSAEATVNHAQVVLRKKATPRISDGGTAPFLWEPRAQTPCLCLFCSSDAAAATAVVRLWLDGGLGRVATIEFHAGVSGGRGGMARGLSSKERTAENQMLAPRIQLLTPLDYASTPPSSSTPTRFPAFRCLSLRQPLLLRKPLSWSCFVCSPA